MSASHHPVPHQSPRAQAPAAPLTTQAIADALNVVLGVRCYSARDIRREIAQGRLVAARYRRRAVRHSILVAPAHVLAWAADELAADDLVHLERALCSTGKREGSQGR